MGKQAVQGVHDLSQFIKGAFNQKDINQIKKLENAEENDKTKKYFFCTESTLSKIRDWCNLKNVPLPIFLQNQQEKNKNNKGLILDQKPEEVYPQELYDWIEKEENKDSSLKGKYVIKELPKLST